MKIFISWSGAQSQYIAGILRWWLRRVIQHLDPWMSELDIGAGQRWASELWKELQDSHFGVVCLTAENLQASWLHFEAGALAKAVDQRVCPYLYEIQSSDVKGLLSHFQMKKADKKETRELLQSINDASTTSKERVLSVEELNEAFETWWPKLEEMLKAVPPSTTAAPPRPKPEDMLEELLDLVRGLERSASAHREELLEIVHRASASPLSAANPAGWFGCTVGWPPASSIPMGSPSVLFAGPITPVPPPDKPQGRSTITN